MGNLILDRARCNLGLGFLTSSPGIKAFKMAVGPRRVPDVIKINQTSPVCSVITQKSHEQQENKNKKTSQQITPCKSTNNNKEPQSLKHTLCYWHAITIQQEPPNSIFTA